MTHDDRLREGGRVQQNLTRDRKFSNNGIDNTFEKVGQKFISLIQNDLKTVLWYCLGPIKLTMLQAWTFAMSFEIRSRIRPGVATTTWTGLSKRRMSSRKSVPPVVAKTLWNKVTLNSNFGKFYLSPQCFPISIQIWDVWRANSRVGTKTKPWISGREVSTLKMGLVLGFLFGTYRSIRGIK